MAISVWSREYRQELRRIGPCSTPCRARWARDDKRRPVRLLLEDAEWGQWSNSEIARRCCVDDKTVAKVRAGLTSDFRSESVSLDSESSENAPAERRYTTKHGTEATMATGRIGKRPSEGAASNVATPREQPTSGPATTTTPDDDGPSAAELLDEMQADLRKAEARAAKLERALAADGKEAVIKLSQRLEQGKSRGATRRQGPSAFAARRRTMPIRKSTKGETRVTHSARSLCAAMLLASLSACGGGGGGDAPTSPPPQQPALASTNVGAAYRNLTRAPRSYSLAGSTSTGVALTATVSIAVGTPTTVNSQTFDSSSITLSVFRSGVLQSTGVTTLLFSPGTTNQAWSFSTPNTCSVATSVTTLPGVVALGQSGPYLTANKYSGCTTANLPTTLSLSTERITQTWSFQAIDGRAYVCMNSSTAGFVGTETEAICFEVADAAGTLGTRLRLTTVDLNRVTTTLSN